MIKKLSFSQTSLLLFIFLLLSLIVSLSFGGFEIPVSRIITNQLNWQEENILYQIRLPRILLSALVGAALAISGGSLQGLFRNPLADPGLIGIASGSALAVAAIIILPISLTGILAIYSIGFAAFIGGVLTCLVIFHFACFRGNFSVTYMLLAGIAINAIAGAATGFLTYFSNDAQLRSLTFWTMGSFGAASWREVFVCFTIIIPAIFLLSRSGSDLDVLSLGEDEAKYLGVDCEKLKKNIVIYSAILVGISVAVSGIIGFVGLVVPHLVRISITPRNKFLLPLSAICGAILLIITDSISRTIITPMELPVGIITSLIGGPFFLWLLIKQYSK